MSDTLLFALTLLVFCNVLLWLLPSGSCSQCWHCKQQRLEKAQAKRDKETEEIRRRKREAHMWHHKTYGKDGCPYCEEHYVDD